MMEMQGINPNIDRQESSSTSNPDGEMVRVDNGEAANDLRAAQAGGREHLKMNLKHHLSNRRSKSMEVGVAGALLNWFGDPHKNSQFFFKVMLDDDEQISNVFWCDHDMQKAYALYGDFVLFDTTSIYMSNNEHRPLGAFLGVNNHQELVVFGACLLFDETTQSFKWLFETFVECMEGKTPQSLFTDQDAGMLVAIPTILPDTQHFLCVWHINRYAVKNLGSLFGNRDFKKDWNKLLFDSDVDDFDVVWFKMIDDHDLHDNEWLQHIYEKREKWAPKYVQSVFCAGKKTMQLSKKFNTTLRRYLKTTMNMTQFLQHFKQAILDMRYKELRMNFDMQDKLPILRLNDPICVHASEVYTPNILKLFVEQTKESNWIVPDCRRESAGSEKVEDVVHVCSCDPTHNCETAKRHVITTINEFHQCSCKYFNFVGIICSHIIWLLTRKNHCFFIPEKYILRRWTRKPMMIATPESAPNVRFDSNSESAINCKKIMDRYSSIIMKYGDAPKAWDVLDRHYAALVKRLMLLEQMEPCEIGEVAGVPRADGALVTIAKQEPKHQSNKQVKSMLEQSKKSLGSLKSGSATSSQPVARHLQLEDEPDVLNED